ncbi:MAG: 16S rRNA processing protein RimM [Clostridia bacterium]|nr:16S rRNA processing protein RimM [Clostridia bacterium]
MEKKVYIECGKIINTHGFRGGVKLESWCNTPSDLASLGRIFIIENGGYAEKKVIKASVFKQFVIAELEGVSDMDAAMALKNTVIYAAREDFSLEDGEFFISDLVGLPVIDADSGKVYGRLSETINRGASDIYVVSTELGERMIPAVDEFIDRIDIEKGIYIRPIAGMFDD